MTEALFSWLNDLFSWIFSLGMGGKLNWIDQYWPTFVLLIAVFVVLMDLLVWFMRYKPYRTWRRILGKLFRRGSVEKAPAAHTENRPRAPRRLPEPPPARKAIAEPPAKVLDEPIPPPRVSRVPEPLPPPPVGIEPPTEAVRIPAPQKPLGIEAARAASDDDIPTLR